METQTEAYETVRGRAAARPIDVLLVEDDPSEVQLTRMVLKTGKVCNELYAVENGEQALAFLRHEGAYAAAPQPDLVLLDLNLPGKDGRQTLAEMRADTCLKDIPVVVVSGSTAEKDIIRAYELNATCYLTKPMQVDDFLEVVRSVANLGLSVVKLPEDEPAHGHTGSPAHRHSGRHGEPSRGSARGG